MIDFMREYISNLMRWVWLVVLLTFIGGVASAYITVTGYIPQYKASVTLLVSAQGYDPVTQQTYMDIMVGQQLVKEYKEIMVSRTVAKAVIEELGLNDIDTGELSENVSVNIVEGTRILEVSVASGSPQMAARLANSFSRVFAEKITNIVKLQNVAVIDPAEEPVQPVDPGHKKNIAIGALAGLLAGVFIVYLIEELDETIKTREDIEKDLGIKILGTIPRIKRKRAGANGYKKA